MQLPDVMVIFAYLLILVVLDGQYHLLVPGGPISPFFPISPLLPGGPCGPGIPSLQ